MGEAACTPSKLCPVCLSLGGSAGQHRRGPDHLSRVMREGDQSLRALAFSARTRRISLGSIDNGR